MTVAVVLDPEYSELEELAQRMPTWAIDVARHRAVAEQLWKDRGPADATQGLTLFRVTDDRDVERNFLSIIGQVDLHHGVYSSGSRIETLKVVGLNFVARTLGAVEALRFCIS